MHGVPESGYEPNYNHRQQFLTTTTTTTTTTTPRPPSPPPPPPPRKYPAQVINITQLDKKSVRLTSHSPFPFSPMLQGTQILSSGLLPPLSSCRSRSLVKWRKNPRFFFKKKFQRRLLHIASFSQSSLDPRRELWPASSRSREGLRRRNDSGDFNER